MNAMHQYLFDAYRAARLGEPAPPAPGTGELALLKAVRERRRLARVAEARREGGSPRRSVLDAFRRGSRPAR
ncbi:hypothetical protein [Streptomyces sp. NPDC059491]|uniref:hypothetical protein n=1 Tax=Streptomyces sp. NPDC059491 TaxID=3346850 RepID=UPI00368FA125